MGCSSSTQTSTQPAKGRDKGDVIVTSDVTDHDFASTDKKHQKTDVNRRQTSAVPVISVNGGSQHQAQQQQQQQTKQQIQQQNTTVQKSRSNGDVTSSKPPSGKHGEDNIAVENVEDLIGGDVKPKPTRKKKSSIMSDPKMFDAIDSHVARVI